MHKEHMPAPLGKRWIGTAEVADKIGCHLMSVPRFVKTKPGFPQPVKPFGRNLWDEAVIDAYVERLIRDDKAERVA